MLANDGQDTIRLSTIKGEVGYRITKFQVIGENPGNANYEAIVKIFKESITGPTTSIDLSDNRLLAVASYQEGAGLDQKVAIQYVIFDNEIINQDIFISSKDISGGNVNYYVELEMLKLNETEATVATLKDIRNNS